MNTNINTINNIFEYQQIHFPDDNKYEQIFDLYNVKTTKYAYKRKI